MILLSVLFVISIILEGSVTTTPLVFILLLNYSVATKKTIVFPIAFLCGILIDAMLGNILGTTSLFYILVLSIVFIYEKKFDIQTFPFIFLTSFLGSVLYLSLTQARFILLTSLFAAVIAVLFFWLIIQADTLHIKDRSKLGYER